MVDFSSIGTVSMNPMDYLNIGNPYTLLLDVFALLFLLGMGYIVFFRGKKLRYHIQIYERENNGVPIPVEVDVLEEKKLNKGKNTMYWLKKNKAEAHPPISKFIYKRSKGLFGSEMWCDYVRERTEYIPARRLVELGITSTMDKVEYQRRMLEIYETEPKIARQQFIFSPLIPGGMPTLKFEPMDYNLNEMLQTKIAHSEALYNDKQTWMSTYGPMLGIGLAAVAIIVVAYLGFQFASQNINSVITAANMVAEKLGDISSRCLPTPVSPAG